MQITALDHEWQQRIKEARASGLTTHAWCMENQIPISTRNKCKRLLVADPDRIQ